MDKDRIIQDAIKDSMVRLGYSSIRPHQMEVLQKVLSGQDALLIAPTGSGKSFIFEALPFAFSYLQKKMTPSTAKDMIILVISPLISLMQLQARNLRKRGIEAAYLQVCMHIADIIRK